MNRGVRLHLRMAAGQWLAWADANRLHPPVIEYLSQRPDHRWSQPTRHEEPLSTPRSWHLVSHALRGFGDNPRPEQLEPVGSGCLAPQHAAQVKAFRKLPGGRHRLVSDVRITRRLYPLAGQQPGRLHRRIERSETWFIDRGTFCREQLGEGLLLHQQQQRGFIPAGLLEEINAVLLPPIPWEGGAGALVQPPVPAHRDPPLPGWRSRHHSAPRTFPPARGARSEVAGYPGLRGGAGHLRVGGSAHSGEGVGFHRQLRRGEGGACGAGDLLRRRPYDLGYLPPGDIAGRVPVRGRGGTVQRPGIDWLTHAPDVPKTGPILVITDGACDVLTIARAHLPAARMPPPARPPPG